MDIKLGLAEKHKKLKKKNLPLTKCPNHEKDIFKFQMLLKKSEL